MCSSGVFCDLWDDVMSSVISICSGVLDRRRMICVSVVIFVGIRLRMARRRGRMS